MTGTFVVSLDFELHWGVRDKRTVAGYRDNLLGVREVVPRLLELFERYGVGASWATVGLLCFETRDELLRNLPAVRPDYERAELDPYPDVESVGEDEDDDPYHLAPSLVREIVDAPGQELASHTFSHFYCLERGATAEAFRADLRAARDVAKRFGVELDSLVLPRNQWEASCLEVARDLGFKAVRGNPDHPLHRARDEAALGLGVRALRWLDACLPFTGHPTRAPSSLVRDGLADVAASIFLRPATGGIVDDLRVRRIRGLLDRAAARDELVHVWWHPHNFGAEPDANLAVLERILESVERHRETGDLVCRTMGEVAGDVLGPGALG